jgi:hypothetical protein
MYLDKYKIEGTINYDQNICFTQEETYPMFQEHLEMFKTDLIKMVNNKECKTFYKFGDGDYFFLMENATGSATPGKRALSKDYSQIDMKSFREGAKLNNYYICEIYPENKKMFNEILPNIEIKYPAEYVYGLTSNKWFFKTFSGRIGLIGANEKIEIIENLMQHDEYKEYLGLDKFNDYIKIPQKFACDDLEETERIIGEQLKNSTSDIFLLGVGHVKSGLTHRLKKYKNAIFLDIGSGIDAIAGVIDIDRPYFGDWTNFKIENFNYNQIDYLNYFGKGKHIVLK